MLTRNEYQTLRHVRDGGEATLRSFDLDHLREEGLIEGPQYRPEITQKGRDVLNQLGDRVHEGRL